MPILSRKVTPLMQVFDMRRSVAWYRDMLGFEVLQTHEPDGHLHWAMQAPLYSPHVVGLD